MVRLNKFLALGEDKNSEPLLTTDHSGASSRPWTTQVPRPPSTHMIILSGFGCDVIVRLVQEPD